MWRRRPRRSSRCPREGSGQATGEPSREARARGRAARRLGRRGERAAARALKRAGYRILARNAVTPRGEVDLLALDGEVLALVEVKTTGAASGPSPTTRFLRPQARRLLAAARWMRRLRALAGRRTRHDLVAVSFDGRRSVVTIRRDVPVRGFARPFR